MMRWMMILLLFLQSLFDVMDDDTDADDSDDADVLKWCSINDDDDVWKVIMDVDV